MPAQKVYCMLFEVMVMALYFVEVNTPNTCVLGENLRELKVTSNDTIEAPLDINRFLETNQIIWDDTYYQNAMKFPDMEPIGCRVKNGAAELVELHIPTGKIFVNRKREVSQEEANIILNIE